MPTTISQNDMEAIFGVIDALGISREAITVPLGRKDPGTVRRMGGDQIQIVLPVSLETEEWLPTLRAELEKLGYRGSG
jgi:hypothetical protein